MLELMQKVMYTQPLYSYCGGDASKCHLKLQTEEGTLPVDKDSCQFFIQIRLAQKFKIPYAHSFSMLYRYSDDL